MTDRLTLEGALTAGGNVIQPVTRADRWRLEQAWREVYARTTHARTGQWRIPDFEWHVFSYGDAQCKRGSRALELYRQEHPALFFAWPEEAAVPMYRCSGGSVPVLTALDVDVYVFPPDLAWTMAFTHELTMDLGPYFSRGAWQGEPGAA